MITEDYVNLEIAKLLKEKGFDEKCSCCYRKKLVDSKIIDEEELFMSASLMLTNSELEDKSYRDIIYCSAPTLQMAMKWLRETHRIGVFPSTYSITGRDSTQETYGTAIINLNTHELMTNEILPEETYEKACERAIKYCLENLI